MRAHRGTRGFRKAPRSASDVGGKAQPSTLPSTCGIRGGGIAPPMGVLVVALALIVGVCSAQSDGANGRDWDIVPNAAFQREFVQIFGNPGAKRFSLDQYAEQAQRLLDIVGGDRIEFFRQCVRTCRDHGEVPDLGELMIPLLCNGGVLLTDEDRIEGVLSYLGTQDRSSIPDKVFGVHTSPGHRLEWPRFERLPPGRESYRVLMSSMENETTLRVALRYLGDPTNIPPEGRPEDVDWWIETIRRFRDRPKCSDCKEETWRTPELIALADAAIARWEAKRDQGAVVPAGGSSGGGATASSTGSSAPNSGPGTSSTSRPGSRTQNESAASFPTASVIAVGVGAILLTLLILVRLPGPSRQL